MVTKIIRKSSAMRVVELKQDKSIDAAICDALIASQGNYGDAAKELGISGSAFSRWIVELGLLGVADQIRRSYGLRTTTNTVNMQNLESTKDGVMVRLGEAIVGECTSCRRTFESLEEPLTLVRFTQRHNKPVKVIYAEIRDGSRRLHWYEINTQVIDDVAEERQRAEELRHQARRAS